MISEIQTINRILSSIYALETVNGSKEIDVADYYTTQYLYPVRDKFNTAKDFCVKTELAKYTHNQLHLNNIGRTYLNLGKRKDGAFILEPNQKQKEYLSRNVFLVSEILSLVKEIFSIFSRGSDGELYLSKTQTDNINNQNLLSLLIQLGILIKSKEVFKLAPQYFELFESVISGSVNVITPEEFQKSQIEIMELSKMAEEYVLQSEKNRLQSANAAEKSRLITHVALKNVAAGYDIASFDGKVSINHDRFIEVKAGKSTPINFFFSRNEFEVARRLKKQYYIYYVGVKDKKPQEIYIFQNPVEGVMKNPKFTINIDTYEISEK